MIAITRLITIKKVPPKHLSPWKLGSHPSKHEPLIRWQLVLLRQYPQISEHLTPSLESLHSVKINRANWKQGFIKKVQCSNVFNTQWVLVTLLSKLRRIYYRWILSKKIVHVILLTPRHHYSICPCKIDWSLKTTLILSIKVICCKLIWNDNLANTFVYS